MSANVFSKSLTYEMSKLAMWIFLATEVLLFSGLFTSYAVYRYKFAEDFHSAAANLNITLGATNTVILILSSFISALAIEAIKKNKIKQVKILILLTLLCGLAFLGIKSVEYTAKIHHGFFPSQLAVDSGELTNGEVMFFFQYFLMTGIHGLHVIIGMSLWVFVFLQVSNGFINSENYGRLEIVGLYWHLVDLIWTFVFPILYLAI